MPMQTRRRPRKMRGGKPKQSKTHCNPYARKHRFSKDSCFTNRSAALLKDLYNKQNPEQPIVSQDGKSILREIQIKANTQCRSDLCTIKQFVKNKNDQNKLKALLFPPPRPEEWDSDPDAWLSNLDIGDVLNQYEKTYPHFAFIGPSPIDYNTRLNRNECVCQKLCDLRLEKYLNQIDPTRGVPVTKIGIVFNLDPHHKGGSHWVSMFIDLEEDFVFYFNSTGARIPKRINTLATNVIEQGRQLVPPKDITFHQNTHTEHQKRNTECGMYCMYFLITMLLREREIQDHPSGGGEKMSMKEVIGYFQGKTNGRIKDKQMFKKRKEYYSAPR